MAEALGVSLYARQLVDGRDRPKLQGLCRYVMRPPLSQERLQWRTDGRLELELKNSCARALCLNGTAAAADPKAPVVVVQGRLRRDAMLGEQPRDGSVFGRRLDPTVE